MTFPPKTKLGQFVFFFMTQAISYFMIVANTRAFTLGYYAWTAVTDSIIAGQNVLMVKVIAGQDEKKGVWAILGCMLGGSSGSLLSMWVTKHLYGS